MHSICQTCKVLLVEANSASIASLGAAENEAAALGAVAISNSWGSSESSSETNWDSAFFDHPGVAITASSGDGGFGVEWPAASPDVTAVGGTTLTVGSGNSYGGESAWADGGSGCSAVETQPAWQAGLGSCPMRSVADVAADADPNTGAAVYDSVAYQGQSGWYQVGGTSLSSPLIASVYALADDTSTISNGSTPYAYRGTSALHDVTTGSNGTCSASYLCNAGVGYDGPTGVGTPDGITAFAPNGSSGSGSGGGSGSGPPPSPDFSLAVSGQSGSPVAGIAGNATYAVTVTPENNLSGSVSLSASGLPFGVTAGFSPSQTDVDLDADAQRRRGRLARHHPDHDQRSGRIPHALGRRDADDRRSGRGLRDQYLAVRADDRATRLDDLHRHDHPTQRLRWLGLAERERAPQPGQRLALAVVGDGRVGLVGNAEGQQHEPRPSRHLHPDDPRPERHALAYGDDEPHRHLSSHPHGRSAVGVGGYELGRSSRCRSDRGPRSTVRGTTRLLPPVGPALRGA